MAERFVNAGLQYGVRHFVSDYRLRSFIQASGVVGAVSKNIVNYADRAARLYKLSRAVTPATSSVTTPWYFQASGPVPPDVIAAENLYDPWTGNLKTTNIYSSPLPAKNMAGGYRRKKYSRRRRARPRVRTGRLTRAIVKGIVRNEQLKEDGRVHVLLLEAQVPLADNVTAVTALSPCLYTEEKSRIATGSQSDVNSDRSGNRIRLSSMQMKIAFVKHATPTFNDFRVIVVRWSSNTVPNLRTILSNHSTGTTAQGSWFNATYISASEQVQGTVHKTNSYKILFDRIFTVSDGISPSLHTGVLMVPVRNSYIDYATSSTTPSGGAIYYFVIGNGSTNLGTFDIQFKTKFSA